MIGKCPLCKSDGVDGGWMASCSNSDCILHVNHQDDTNAHVIKEQWPKAVTQKPKPSDEEVKAAATALFLYRKRIFSQKPYEEGDAGTYTMTDDAGYIALEMDAARAALEAAYECFKW